MTEVFLHYIWQHQLFEVDNLRTTDGQLIEVVKPGEYNTDAGPDFFSSHIRLNNTLWVGTVEIHLKSSEWKKHRHDQDAAYDNCILHVVFENDEHVHRKDGERLATLELKGRFANYVWENYQALMGTYSWIPCAHRINEVSPMVLNQWLDRLSVERLEKKSTQIFQMLELNNADWEETFYQLLCSGFGFQINSLPFTMLSRKIPFQFLMRFRDKPRLVEALFFGCGGFLNVESADDYTRSLQNDFLHFKKVHQLESIDHSCWKFLRLRPVNFPTIRIAQLVALITSAGRLFSVVLALDDFNSGKKIFKVKASSYWDSHFIFGKEAVESHKFLGEKSIENLFINVIIPVLFAYGIRNDSMTHRVKAIELLEQIQAEDNSVIRNWGELGVKSSSAFQSQALLELKKHHCSEKKCLTCRIGVELINHLP
ncbi:MAG: DUF2851 family protein [Bacteroidetes bacterium]|nr:MAG: DUF2851 family protein [Bacteroidota bacterium]